MSFDAIIAAHTAALTTNTEALRAVAELLRQSNEGREAAMVALGSAPAADKPARAARKAKDDALPVPVTTAPESTSPKASSPKLPNAEEVRKAFGDWVGETNDAAERENRKVFVKSLIDHFGARPAELEPEKMAEVLFYLARHKGGIRVDFSADYDFAGDPTQGSEAPAEAEDMFG